MTRRRILLLASTSPFNLCGRWTEGTGDAGATISMHAREDGRFFQSVKAEGTGECFSEVFEFGVDFDDEFLSRV